MLKLIFIALLLINSSAFAQDCNEIGDYQKMESCYHDSFNKSYRQLNLKYKNLLSQLTNSPNTKKAFIQNQRDWLKYAENYCELAYAEEPDSRGTFSRVAISICLDDLYSERIEQFNQMACEEGNMSSTCIITKPSSF